MLRVNSIVNSVFNSMTYFVYKEGASDLYIIDCGDSDAIIEYVRKNDLILNGVFVTHAHFDHIYGLNGLIDYFPNCIVHVSRESEAALFSDRLNFSRYHERSFVFQGNKVNILEDGDQIELWKGHNLEVIATPGHDKGCMCYKIGHYLFTGDAFIPGIKTVTMLRGGNKEDSERSLAKIRTLLSADMVVCAGHGSVED